MSESLFLIKSLLIKVFFWEFCEIFKNIFVTVHLWTTASVAFILLSLSQKSLFGKYLVYRNFFVVFFWKPEIRVLMFTPKQICCKYLKR